MPFPARRPGGCRRGGDASIAEVAASVGYDAEAVFRKAFKRRMGMALEAYRRRRAGTPLKAAS